MAAGTSLFSAIAGIAGTIYEGAVYALRETVSIMPSVTVFGDVSGFAPRIGELYGTVTFDSVAETVDLTPQLFDPTNQQTLTPGEFGTQVMISDRRLESDPQNYLSDVALEMGLAAADGIDVALAQKFASFTGGTIGSAAGTVRWQDISAAKSLAKGLKVPGPYWCVLHPYQWKFLVNEAVTNGGVAGQISPAISEQIMRQYFVSSLFGDVTFIVSANVQIGTSGGTAGTAGFYNRQALAYDQRRGLRIEPFRDPSFRHTELNATMAFATGVWLPARGITLLGTAPTPS